MGNLKEIRTRISSVSSTMQITSAMKMVSAAKLKRAQDAVTQMKPYAEKLKELLENVSATLENSSEGRYSVQRPVEKVLLVAITSNRGLCGGFNANVIKSVSRQLKETYAGKDVSLFTIGKKVNDFFKNKEVTIANHNTEIYDDLNFDNVAVIAQDIMDRFVEGEYDHVELVYNSFRNAAVQEIMNEQFLPVKSVDKASDVNMDYIFEPSKEEIIEDLIPKSLKIQVFKALLDSYASEHGARMTAMHQATDNASDLNAKLKLDYNRQRQAAITNEILEIVGGANALG